LAYETPGPGTALGPSGWLGMVLGPPRVYPPLPWIVIGALQAVEWFFVIYTLYTVCLPIAGLWTRQITVMAPPRSRFAIVVPAHNEERVIEMLIRSCRAIDYPAELVDIYVVADNCTDATAEVAAAAGASVIRRENREERGKGYALDYAFRVILSGRRSYDAFVVFDADNLVHPDFLKIMNSHLCRGDRIIQGRMDAKNPTDTWISSTFAMSVWVSNRFWFLAKYNLGLSSVLGGTGMCIAADLIRDIGWGAHSFTEDLEFTMKALSRGVKTVWAHNAICYDEKVQTFGASWRQRRRWVQGQTTVAGTYIARMAWRGLTEGDPVLLDAAFQLFTPFYLILGTVLMALGYLVPGEFLAGTLLQHLDSSGFWVLLAAVEYSMPLVAALMDRAPLRALVYLPLYPVFVNSWLPLAWSGIFGRRPRHWTHTEHTRAMTYSDLLVLHGTERR
jgi:cellulose synthase/poly-beta-1,6-N-acetylglucosamine synthase-like glycosyltransferase